MQMDANHRISRFVEKPHDPAVQDTLRIDPGWYADLGIQSNEELFLASMGIYVFSREIIFQILENDLADFGKHIIPQAISEQEVYSYVFQGYWEDIGTIRAFFEANLDLANELPRFNFFDMASPIFSRPRFLPGSKINGAQVDHAVITDGCIINRATISHSVIGLRCIVEPGTVLNRTILLGSDYYESMESIAYYESLGHPRLGIGSNCRIENTIIDKNARIGNGVVISPAGKPENVDHPLYYIRDGIVIIPKNGVIPDGTVI
jgi:glucose-1-phosphate adenylyltransferase